MNKLDMLYQDSILDHSRMPRNFFVMEHCCQYERGYNPLCGDDITVFVGLNPDSHTLELSFTGQGCAISTASGSMMTEALKQQSPQEALQLCQRVIHALTDDQSAEHANLGHIEALLGVKQFPMRVKCATLAWHALSSCLHKLAADPSA